MYRPNPVRFDYEHKQAVIEQAAMQKKDRSAFSVRPAPRTAGGVLKTLRSSFSRKWKPSFNDN